MIAHVGPGGNKSALASFETSQRWIVHVFTDIFSLAGYPSLVDEQDTPQGEALLQTGHLSSLTIHQFPFKQLVNKGVYSFKLNHWKAAQATVELVNQFAIQSHGWIALLVSQAKNKKNQLNIMKAKLFWFQTIEHLPVYEQKCNIP